MSAPFLSREDRFQRFLQLTKRIREGGEDNEPENILHLLYNGMNSEIFKAEAEIRRMRESNSAMARELAELRAAQLQVSFEIHPKVSVKC
jgi:predicted metalloprotease